MVSLIDGLSKLDASIQAVLLTACLAFIGWLVQSFVTGPVERSREAFFSLLNKRVEINAQMRSFLAMIDLFKDNPAECMKLKEELQGVLLSSGSVGYLDQALFSSILEVAVNESTDAKKVHDLIRMINQDMDRLSGRVAEETSFFVKYYHPDPVRRIARLASLIVRSTILIGAALALTYWVVLQLLSLNTIGLVVVLCSMMLLAWQAVRIGKFILWLYRR